MKKSLIGSYVIALFSCYDASASQEQLMRWYQKRRAAALKKQPDKAIAAQSVDNGKSDNQDNVKEQRRIEGIRQRYQKTDELLRSLEEKRREEGNSTKTASTVKKPGKFHKGAPQPLPEQRYSESDNLSEVSNEEIQQGGLTGNHDHKVRFVNGATNDATQRVSSKTSLQTSTINLPPVEPISEVGVEQQKEAISRFWEARRLRNSEAFKKYNAAKKQKEMEAARAEKQERKLTQKNNDDLGKGYGYDRGNSKSLKVGDDEECNFSDGLNDLLEQIDGAKEKHKVSNNKKENGQIQKVRKHRSNSVSSSNELEKFVNLNQDEINFSKESHEGDVINSSVENLQDPEIIVANDDNQSSASFDADINKLLQEFNQENENKEEENLNEHEDENDDTNGNLNKEDDVHEILNENDDQYKSNQYEDPDNHNEEEQTNNLSESQSNINQNENDNDIDQEQGEYEKDNQSTSSTNIPHEKNHNEPPAASVTQGDNPPWVIDNYVQDDNRNIENHEKEEIEPQQFTDDLIHNDEQNNETDKDKIDLNQLSATSGSANSEEEQKSEQSSSEHPIEQNENEENIDRNEENRTNDEHHNDEIHDEKQEDEQPTEFNANDDERKELTENEITPEENPEEQQETPTENETKEDQNKDDKPEETVKQKDDIDDENNKEEESKSEVVDNHQTNEEETINESNKEIENEEHKPTVEESHENKEGLKQQELNTENKEGPNNENEDNDENANPPQNNIKDDDSLNKGRIDATNFGIDDQEWHVSSLDNFLDNIPVQENETQQETTNQPKQENPTDEKKNQSSNS